MNCFTFPLIFLLTLTPTLANALEPPLNTLPYPNLTLLAAHDSPFIGPRITQNQNLNVTAQLDLGIRFLQGQTHRAPDDEDRLQLCHSSCLLEDGGSLADFLGLVKGWLEENPGEVVTLLLTNGDRVGVEMFGGVFGEVGLDGLAYVPGDGNGVLPLNQWPSVQEMVDMGKRLVVFLDYGANPSSTPYILDEFAYFFETPFGETDPSFPNCSIDRPPGASADNRMYIVNHFLNVDILGVKVPDRIHAARTNAVAGNGSIGAQAELCEGMHGRKPNVVLVDFVDQGEVIEAQRMLNGLRVIL